MACNLWSVGLLAEDGEMKHLSSCYVEGSTATPNSKCKRKVCEDPFITDVRIPTIRHHTEMAQTERLAQDLHEKKKYGGLDRTLLSSRDISAYISLLRACTKKKDLQEGAKIHEDIRKRGILKECSDELVIMYAKCGDLSTAQELLFNHQCRSVFAWNALIGAYARKEQGYNALSTYWQMQQAGLTPNAVTYSCILKACGSSQLLNQGQQFHDEIARKGLLAKDLVLGNALIDMYAKCGALTKAHRVLTELPLRDVVSWNSLIGGYAQYGLGEQAMACFEQMQGEGVAPNEVTFTCLLKVCGTLEALDRGKWIHNQISKRGLLRDNVMLGTALVDMYAKCGSLEKAKEVLKELSSRDIVAWNALIVGYAQHGYGEQALRCYETMQEEGLEPDAVTFSGIIKACGCIGDLEKAEQIHREILRHGIFGNNMVVGNALVAMYVKCGALEKAQRVLHELPQQDVVTWNTYMAGLIQEDQGEQVLMSFEKMQSQGLEPTPVTFVCILKACGLLGAAARGKQIHDEISRQGLLDKNIMLGTAVVDMYAKCGAVGKAAKVLKDLPFRDTVTWNALIAGYAQQGPCEQVLDCFKQMQAENCHPDSVTFACVLNACSHLGLVDDGLMFLKDMNTKYGIKQGVEHYTCMIDLLGRSGHLDKAIEMIHELPLSDDCAVWSALLDACGKWGDLNVGRWAFKNAIVADESDAAAYVLMSNTQAATGAPQISLVL